MQVTAGHRRCVGIVAHSRMPAPRLSKETMINNFRQPTYCLCNVVRSWWVNGTEMTDKKWHDLIIKCKAACDEHLSLLKIAEKEYERRYGHLPSEVDDDWWIDTLHYGRGSTDLELIKKAAELHTKR